jgi:hypothetical protein
LAADICCDRCFHCGDYDIAITLAAAAEGMAPKEASHGLFRNILANPNRPIADKKLWNAKLNATRDWLKHPTERLEQSRKIAAIEAAFFIFRAMDKVSPWSEKMDAFKQLYFSSPRPV